MIHRMHLNGIRAVRVCKDLERCTFLFTMRDHEGLWNPGICTPFDSQVEIIGNGFSCASKSSGLISIALV
jgi:hypothetical protein